MPETQAAVMKYEARDGVEITLTFDTIKRYLVQGHAEYVTASEFMYFMGVCKSGGLNPFKRDCYLIKYSQKDNAAIITAIDFLRSRAKAQQDCKGWNAGIILQKGTELEYREGTLILEDEKLVGGWFEGKPAGWDKPIRWTVPLKTYLKKTREGNLTRFWETDNQPGQIAKVAETQGLKKCWPAEFQNLYTDAEIAPDDGVKGLPEITEETGKEVDAEFDADAHEDFDNKVPKDAKAERMKEFLALVQQSAEKTLFEIKQEAFDHWDEFWASFLKWEGKNYGEDKPEPSDKDPIREEYINLRTKGFKPWVMANLERIPGFPDHNRKEIGTKYTDFYPGEPLPWVKPESPTQDEIARPGGENEGTDTEQGDSEQPPLSAEEEIILSTIEGAKLDIAGRLCVPCPNQNGRAILTEHCRLSCEEREGCPTFEEYDRAGEEVSN